ncbi:toll/interleukin-1 receptor domain-containing protein [Pseudomonas bijieensis]|uniref:toll/interleukin-1 receptor domain-containing protein n=1 Tax=Pseudomonas bijieensis TaxID=2681983 RepID=UPI001E45CC56|nr:toll/interleukin-1 receptor domain-containing protein [Pseudomonas bijieensis]MCD9117653.1 toll/interleukin-1 receptor domain-containing protein [Pseudomonas bijieensis]
MKFFLSHSSSDKNVVEKVYEQLGAALCHYDVATFDNTSFLPEQIYEALNESTHFILFASQKALSSDWVKGELRTAFSLWMKAKIRSAMVFLINDGERSEIPSWLQDYVIIEHPSAHHISCRILSAFDDWESQIGNEPPFYRYAEAMQLEKSVSVEPSKSPTTLMLCGADGYGRKQLANELFKRRFSGLARRKLSFSIEDHDSEVNFYRHVLGITSLFTPTELSQKTKDFLNLHTKERYEIIVEHIIEATRAGQAIYVDVGSAGLDDSGKITSWLEGIVLELPRATYPRLVLISARRPIFLPSQTAAAICLQKIEPLPREESELLFSWWLNKLNISNTQEIIEHFIDLVDGRPKSIELAARTLATVDPSQLNKQKPNIAKDIQAQAATLLKAFENNRIANMALAITAYSGYISEVDLIESLKTITDVTPEDITDSLNLLISYGFILQDSISIKLPGYLRRIAADLLNSSTYSEDLKPAISYLINANNNIDPNEKTNVSTIEDFCIARLRKGQHSIIGLDSLILPSQCLRLAKEYYNNQDYETSYTLCETAYRGRLALTDESALEVLRYKGLSAARLNKQTELTEVLNSFSNHKNSIKAKRLHAFIKGFNLRLSGSFDEALAELNTAYSSKGEGDIHILRELSFLHCYAGDLTTAERLIKKAHQPTDNNSYIIQMYIRILLAKGKGHVLYEEPFILELIGKLDTSQRRGTASASSMMRAELHYAIGNISAAKGIAELISETTPIKILKAKIQIKEGKYPAARDALGKLKTSLIASHEGQRQTSIPEVCHSLIEAAAAISIIDGMHEFERNIRLLPQRVIIFWREFFIRELGFTQTKPTATQRRLLNLS